jgi:hypothetical protein
MEIGAGAIPGGAMDALDDDPLVAHRTPSD